MQKIIKLILCFTIVLSFLIGNEPREYRVYNWETECTADIVIYGGTFAGVAATAKAARQAPDKEVVLIVPESGHMLGGLGTSGGQNYLDQRMWNGGQVQKGSMEWWRNKVGRFYDPHQLSNQMKRDLARYQNITIYYGYDIKEVRQREAPRQVESVLIQQLTRMKNGHTLFLDKGENISIAGGIFIDASDEGRLSRLSHFEGSVGRFDWPIGRLPCDEQNPNTPVGQQQVATLMFKIEGFDPDAAKAGGIVVGDHSRGDNYAEGGHSIYADPKSKMSAFNREYMEKGYGLKPFNMAQDREGNYWINTLLIFDVDGRAWEKDRGTSRFPEDMMRGHKTVDHAWTEARTFLASNMQDESSLLMQALRSIPGFGHVNICVNEDGSPVVGEQLYLRETIHATGTGAKVHGSENNNYAMQAKMCHEAGTGPYNGEDKDNYHRRIGLLYYWTDINAYRCQDIWENGGGGNEWSVSSTAAHLRKDIKGIHHKSPENPVYAPYEILLTPFVENLLIPGYAANCSSFAWSEVRALPNLAVLGDAAGVAAAYAVNRNKKPGSFTTTDIQAIQDGLRAMNVRLDK